jgi:hypothetical protein
MKGHIRIGLFGRRYLAHRLIYLYETGNWPSGDVDHINNATKDNRGLRIASHHQNGANRGKPKNNSSGWKWVSWDKRDKKWDARVTTYGVKKYLGYFTNPNEAYLTAYDYVHIHLGEYAHG